MRACALVWGMLAGVALAAIGTDRVAARAGGERVLHEERSLYRNILVYETDSQRCLKFGRSATDRQSCMQLNNPDYLVFNYTRMMMAALYLNPAPTRILVIGLGGGTLPTALRKVVPGARIDVVEIDPAVVKVAHQYFGFTTGPDTQEFEEDGRVFVKHKIREGVHYDLVMLDAFTDQYIPEHLLTREFLTEVKSILTAHGVLAANTFATSSLYEHESATYETVFGPFYGLKSRNRVILVRLGGLPPRGEIEGNARELESRLRVFGTGKDWLRPLFAVESGWVGKARVLTDQYSPGNLLNAQ
jgi:spermidine synthase